jgi:hypothetical protein
MNQPNPPHIPSYFAPSSVQPAVGQGAPLTPEQIAEIARARELYRKVRRATGVATFDAWATATFAGLTLLVTLMSFSLTGLLVGAGMAVVAWNGFRGLKMLKALDPEGARVLGWNQILLGSVLFLYAAWNLVAIATGAPGSMFGSLKDQLEGLDTTQIESVVRSIAYLVYGSLALFAIIAQGLTSLYYFSRGRYVRDYVEKSAGWVLQMQRAGFSL